MGLEMQQIREPNIPPLIIPILKHHHILRTHTLIIPRANPILRTNMLVSHDLQRHPWHRVIRMREPVIRPLVLVRNELR